jgi:hypothetical protein
MRFIKTKTLPYFGWFALVFLVGCATTPYPQKDLQPQIEPTTALIDDLLRKAELSSGNLAVDLRLEAITELLQAGFPKRAEAEMKKIQNLEGLLNDSQLRFTFLKAKIAVTGNQTDIARKILTDSLTENTDTESLAGLEILLLLGQLYLTENKPELAIEQFAQITEFWPVNVITTLYEDIWSALSLINDNRLSEIARGTASYELRGWIELARISKSNQKSIRRQLDSITQWRRIWAQHSAATRPPRTLIKLQETWNDRPKHIALILPIRQPAGNAIQEGFLSAYYQELNISREVPQISVYDSTEIDEIGEVYNQAVGHGADLVVGPLNKNLVNQLQEIGKLPVTTLALNYTDKKTVSENFFQFGLAPEDEILEIINLAWEAGHRNAAILMPDELDYKKIERFFLQSWADKGGQVVSVENFNRTSDYSEVVRNLFAIGSSESRAEKLLDLLPRREMEFTPRRRNDIDFIFLLANPRQGRQINPTLAFYFADDIPVYSMPSIYDGEDNQVENRDLNGIVFADAPWILSPKGELNNSIEENLRKTRGALKRLRALGIDSFRLYARLNQFYDGDTVSIQGATGLLTVSENQIINRELETAEFIDGIATPYSLESSKSIP